MFSRPQMRQSSFGSGPFHLRHWGPKQRENDWLDDELFRGGELRNEPAMLERERKRRIERARKQVRETEFSPTPLLPSPLSLLSLLVEGGNSSKKLAPNCTNACHRKFAKIKYWCGCSDRAAERPGADWRGEVFAQGSIGRLNLHVTLHQRQRKKRGETQPP